jgi:hypothetical protein
MSAPTYGTGKRADMQLMEDLSGLMTIAPPKKPPIDYSPRPDIVPPASSAALPAPQDNIVRTTGEWPETPEQRLARLRAEATANQDNPLYKSPIRATGYGEVNQEALNAPDPNGGFGEGRGSAGFTNPTTRQQTQRFRENISVERGAYQGRRFLSDPPEALKVAADTAPVGELGEAESKKEARRKKNARKNQGFSLRNLWPW